VSKRTAKNKAKRQEVTELRQEISALTKIANDLINTNYGLRERLIYDESRLTAIEGALAKMVSENFSMAQAIRELQDLDADRIKIINYLDGRINKLEKPIGFWTKIFGRK